MAARVALVTGANGHLGNNLVRALLTRGFRVRAGVRNPENKRVLSGLECEVVHADLLDRDSLLKALEGVDILYQVAAVFKFWVKKPEQEIMKPNVKGTRFILEAAAQQKVKKTVYVSSIAALDHSKIPMDESTWNPDKSNPYYYSKRRAEEIAWEVARERDLWMVSVLPSTIIGPNCFRLTPSMAVLQDALKNKLYADVNFHFNWVDVRDVAEGCIRAEEKGRNGERYCLANHPPVSLTRVVELAKQVNPRVRRPFIKPSKQTLLFLAGMMEKISKITGKPPQLTRQQVEMYWGVRQEVDFSKAKSELGYDPREPEQAILQALHYLHQDR